MQHKDVTEMIVLQKMKKQLSWMRLAEAISHSKEWSTTMLLEQMTLTEAQAEAVGVALDPPEEAIMSLQMTSYKGLLPTSVPMDPLICHFYELISVYDATLKALIHEESGDGIVSTIDFNMDLTHGPDPKGSRVYIVIDSKPLSYKTY